MLDPRFTLHEKVISTIERIMPPDKNPDLGPGFLRFKETTRVPVEPNPSSFEADHLQLTGWTSFNDLPDGSPHKIEDLHKGLFHVEITLFRDASPYMREKDLDNPYEGGLHSLIVGDDIPPTLVSFGNSFKIHDNPYLLAEFLRRNRSELASVAQVTALEVALGQLTTSHIDFPASIQAYSSSS